MKPAAAPPYFAYAHRTMAQVMERERLAAEDANCEFIKRLWRERRKVCA